MVGVCEQAGFVKDGKIPRVGGNVLADACRHDIRRGDRDVDGDELYRERGRSRRRRTNGIKQHVRRRRCFWQRVFFAAGGGDSRNFATAPALVLVGALMTESIAQVEWKSSPKDFRRLSH